MLFKNLTTHKVNIHTENGRIIEVSPSGEEARVSIHRKVVDRLGPHSLDECPDAEVSGLCTCSIAVGTDVPGEVVGLPEPQEGVVYITSTLVRLAVPGRKDVMSPGPLVKDMEGNPIGCLGLTRN
jgi:hypothetical protein